MLVLRKEQQNALAQIARNVFSKRLKDHLVRNFPDQCRDLGESGLKEAIAYGMKRGDYYGITSGKAMCLFFNLMFTFGRDFDTDETLPWAQEIISGPGSLEDEKTMRQLYSLGIDNIAMQKGYLKS